MQSLLLVSGLSGAGKSTVMRALEDIGYYCVDNLPVEMVPELLTRAQKAGGRMTKLAITADVRGGIEFGTLLQLLSRSKAGGMPCRLLFLDADNDIVANRYKETRRSHPLMSEGGVSLQQAIKEERRLLKPLFERADFVIDTGHLSTSSLKERITLQFTESSLQAMVVTVLSFGFKHGVPTDADLMFDVRCLPNPFYIKELKGKTGLEHEVYDYVFGFDNANLLYKHIEDQLLFSLPLYIKEGKCQLCIAVGCTGGKHRSVSFARRICDTLTKEGYKVETVHRDITR